MVLAEGDQWHPGNAEALGDEGMATTKSSLGPGEPLLRWVHPLKALRQARFSLPYKIPRILSGRFREGGTWS